MRSDLSPSRSYVAVIMTNGFDSAGESTQGSRFRKFRIPLTNAWGFETEDLSGVSPSWYFLNRLDGFACIEGIVTEEDFEEVGWHYSQSEHEKIEVLGVAHDERYIDKRRIREVLDMRGYDISLAQAEQLWLHASGAGWTDLPGDVNELFAALAPFFCEVGK